MLRASEWAEKVNLAAKQTKRIPAVVLSSGYAALALIRSLGRRGIPVFVLDSRPSEVGMHSRYGVATVLPQSNQPLWAEFLREAGARLECKPALMAANDDSLEAISGSEGDLRGSYRFRIPHRELLLDIADKRRQYQRLIALGCALPETRFPQSPLEASQMASEIGFPCLAKPALGREWKSKFVHKLVVVGNPEEAADAFRVMEKLECGMVLQRRVAGGDDHLYTVMANLGKAEPWAMAVKRKLRQFPEAYGNGSVSVSCGQPELLRATRTILCGIGYRGLGCIEYKLDPADQVFKLIEINPRPVSGSQLAADAGCDLPWIAYQDTLGEAAQFAAGWRSGMIHVNLPWEVRRVWASRSPAEALWSALQILRARSFAEMSLDDPGPAISLAKRALRRGAGPV